MKKHIIGLCIFVLVFIGVFAIVLKLINSNEITKKVEFEIGENKILSATDSIAKCEYVEINKSVSESNEDSDSGNSYTEEQNNEQNEYSNYNESAVVKTAKNNEATVPENDSSENTQTQEKEENATPKCSETTHIGISVGNSNKWFDTKDEAISYYNDLIAMWGKEWENFEIDTETYNKNCPCGYEVWSCYLCGKWTINFYYR